MFRLIHQCGTDVVVSLLELSALLDTFQITVRRS